MKVNFDFDPMEIWQDDLRGLRETKYTLHGRTHTHRVTWNDGIKSEAPHVVVDVLAESQPGFDNTLEWWALRTEVLLEATFEERFSLWTHWAPESDTCNADTPVIVWASVSTSYGRRVGSLADMPVMVCYHPLILIWEGRPVWVMSYEATSQVVDWRMVKADLATRFPNVKARTDAGNFLDVRYWR